ncbi:MAG: nucleoside hydrolase [Nitrososphaerota archaeon]
MLHLILDTDTAGDDTIAMLMALRASNAKLEAVTINCGNIDFDQQVENALYTIEFAGMSGKVPVYPGARHPLLKDWKTAEYVHGRDGMGNSNFPRAKQRPENRHAVDAIIEAVNAKPGEITIVEIAPMTNLAMALRKDPSIADKVKALYFMGGTNYYQGNVTPAAEFNIWVDPDAAKIVLNSGIPTTMVGWEICMRSGLLDRKEYTEIQRFGTKESEFFMSVNRQVLRFMKRAYGLDAITCPDSITMAIVLNPSIVKSIKQRYVEVDNVSEISRGATWIDELMILKRRPNVNVVYEASHAAFKDMLSRLLMGEKV